MAIIGIIAAIAVPGLLRARMSGNEASAIGSMRAINSAEASYSSAAGQGGYAIPLVVLAALRDRHRRLHLAPTSRGPLRHKSGYTLRWRQRNTPNDIAEDCNATNEPFRVLRNAVPLQVSSTGQRAFSTAAAGTIYFDSDGRGPRRKRAARRYSNDTTRKTTHEEVPENGHLFVFQDVVR